MLSDMGQTSDHEFDRKTQEHPISENLIHVLQKWERRPIMNSIARHRNTYIARDGSKFRSRIQSPDTGAHSFGTEWGRGGSPWAHIEGQRSCGLQEVFWMPPRPLGHHLISKNVNIYDFHIPPHLVWDSSPCVTIVFIDHMLWSSVFGRRAV